MDKKIKLISTKSVVSLSVTGSYCELSCKHCNKKYLNSMIDIKDENLNDFFKEKNTALISGGSLKNGSVPFYLEYEKVKKLKEKGISINAHTGYIPSEQFSKTLIFDAISIDIVGSNKILKEIYNLNVDLKELQENLLNYNDFLQKIEEKKPIIVPHITIGIYYGKDSYEEQAIDFIAKINPEKLVLNVLIPTKNTFFEKIKEIEINRILEVYSYAKNKLGINKIYLGCMRPFGKFREKLDFALLENGINGIVNPSKKLFCFLEKNQENFIKLNGCCSLL